MSNLRKNVDERNKIPMVIFLKKVKKIFSSIQKNVEFIFVLKGEIKVTVNNQKYILSESDVILINNGDIFEISGEEENLILSMEIDSNFFNDVVKREQNLFFCNSAVDDNISYEEIRKIMSKIMYEYSYREPGYEYKMHYLLI